MFLGKTLAQAEFEIKQIGKTAAHYAKNLTEVAMADQSPKKQPSYVALEEKQRKRQRRR